MKNKNIILVIVGIILVMLFFTPGTIKESKKETSADVSVATITRSMSAATVKIATTFTDTYTAAGFGAGSWGVLISDSASGGCTPSTINDGFLAPTTSKQITMTAPSSAGTCSFTGTYVFAGSTDKTILGTSSVNVCEDACITGSVGCVDITTMWTCISSGVCKTKSNTVCQSFESCSGGVCVANCATLKSSALSSIVAWASSPTSSTKTTALNAIVSWASNC